MTTDEMRAVEDARLAAVFHCAPEPVIAETTGGIITAWNDAATLLYGHHGDQVLGCSIEVIIPAQALREERARRARIAAGATESGYRCLRVRADGLAVEVVMSMSPIRDATGDVVGITSITRPVSEQERADTRYSALLAAAPDAILCVDETGAVVLANARACAMFGYPREDLVGETIEALLPEQVRESHSRLRDGFLREPRPRAMGSGVALRARRRDGSTFPVEISLAPDQTQEFLVIVAVRDVTEERANEARLLESETRLRQLTEHSDVVFSLTQLDPPAILYLSPSFQAMSGLAPEQVEGDHFPLLRIVHPDDLERVQRLYQRAMAEHGSLHSEHRIVRANGEVRWVRVLATPIPNPYGPPERLAGSAEDITDRILAAQALQDSAAALSAANEAKNEFLSRMSHELRTPMNAVLGFGQLLERRLEGTEHVEPIRHILHAGTHLLELINEVLDISRIEAGALTVSPEAVSITTMVDEATMLMHPLAEAAGVTLTISGGPAGHYVRADRQRVRQILLNLVSNAVKYNRAGGSVWLSWEVVGASRSVVVRDDGPGIAPENLDRLFAPFDRLGAEATEVEGTGIGLTVTRGLAELMGGTVTVDSDLGTGSTFRVTLPEATAPITPVTVGLVPAAVEAGAPFTPPAQLTLLYVEDNEPNVLVMKSIIELRPEWRMIHAGLVGLGVELARTHQPALILLDVHLPDGDGIDVLTALNADPRTASIRVVALSADASRQQVKRLLAGGVDRYLTKPLNVDEILALLDDVVRLPAAGRRRP